MPSCRRIRPLLTRAVDHELAPQESLRVARHLSACTACRIVMARERRLSEMLDGMRDEVPVGRDFPGEVMAALPEGPPPRREAAVRRRRRGLGIAGVVGWIGLGAGLAWRLAGLQAGTESLPGLPRLSFESMEPVRETCGGILRLAVLVLARVGAGFRPSMPGWFEPSELHALGLAPAIAVLFMLSSAVALAARSGLRRSRGPSFGSAEQPETGPSAGRPPADRHARR